MDWDDEKTLVALFKDEYVLAPLYMRLYYYSSDSLWEVLRKQNAARTSQPSRTNSKAP